MYIHMRKGRLRLAMCIYIIIVVVDNEWTNVQQMYNFPGDNYSTVI